MSIKRLETLALVLVVVIVRALFAIYRPVTTFGFVLLLCVLALYFGSESQQALWFYTAIGVCLFVLIRGLISTRQSGATNPLRAYFGKLGTVNRTIDQFIRWLGTIKIYRSPWTLIEEPQGYQIRGDEMRRLVGDLGAPTTLAMGAHDGANFQLQPGDILLRGYDGYLDGELIKLADGSNAGLGSYLSHAAFYLGELGPKELDIAARRLRVLDDDGQWRDATAEQIAAIRHDPDYVITGPQIVIHAMSKGVFCEDILTFLRCDYLVVLRLPEITRLTREQHARMSQNAEFQAYRRALKQRGLLTEKGAGADAVAIINQLAAEHEAPRAELVAAIRESALGKIGSCYDFQFSEIHTGAMFSCSEFVYYCFKSIQEVLGIYPKPHALMGQFLTRITLTPADLYAVAKEAGGLEVAYISDSFAKVGGQAGKEYEDWIKTRKR